RACAEVDLVGGHTEGRPCRRADLGRIIRESAEIFSGQGRGPDELRAHQLHAIAGISREADDDGLGYGLFGLDHLQSQPIKSRVAGASWKRVSTRVRFRKSARL